MTPKDVVTKLGYPLPEGWVNDPEQADAIKAVWPQIQAHNEKIVGDALTDATRDLLALLRATDEKIGEIKAAFGAPGDWGYGQREGQALFALYKHRVEVRNALAAAAGAP